MLYRSQYVGDVMMAREIDGFDVPLGGLVSLGHIKFDRTHLEAAVAEVRMLTTEREISETEAVRIWEALGKEGLPIFERQTKNLVSLTVTPTGHQQTQDNQHGWILASADRKISVTIYPSLIAVQTTKYDHFQASLGEPLANALRHFMKITGNTVVNRIGVRFINKLQDSHATTPSFWVEHIRPGFVGPLTESISSLVVATHQQTQLQLDDTSGARIISGVFREQTSESQYSFLVDLDVFKEQAFEYEEELCANLTRQLDRTAFSLFSHVITPNHLDALGPVVLEDPK